MQDGGGGWGAFDAANTKRILRDVPFCDFGEVIDPPSADVTAHALEMLAAAGRGDSDGARGAALAWLTAEQEAGRLLVRALGRQPRLRHRRRRAGAVAAGVAPVRRAHPPRRALARGATRTPTAAGARTRAPTATRRGSGAAPSTASQTAWALLALARRGRALARRSRAASRFLVDTQREDGGWDEPQYTGTGFPGDFYINYHLYRVVFPIMALARCAR